jgi:nitrate/nitrite transporter NarK
VCRIEHQYIGTATGLMLMVAAVGGFFIPIIFGHLVSHTSFGTGWFFLAIVSFAFALIGLAGRNPAMAANRSDPICRLQPSSELVCQLPGVAEGSCTRG